MQPQDHWDSIYAGRQADELSWYRPHLERSLALLTQAGSRRDASIIDVGGGASTFVDDLLDLGFLKVTVLDLSSIALECSGLPVVRYSVEGLHALLGPAFQLESSDAEVHLTPWGVAQEFFYGHFRMLA